MGWHQSGWELNWIEPWLRRPKTYLLYATVYRSGCNLYIPLTKISVTIIFLPSSNRLVDLCIAIVLCTKQLWRVPNEYRIKRSLTSVMVKQSWTICTYLQLHLWWSSTLIGTNFRSKIVNTLDRIRNHDPLFSNNAKSIMRTISSTVKKLAVHKYLQKKSVIRKIIISFTLSKSRQNVGAIKGLA